MSSAMETSEYGRRMVSSTEAGSGLGEGNWRQENAQGLLEQAKRQKIRPELWRWPVAAERRGQARGTFLSRVDWS